MSRRYYLIQIISNTNTEYVIIGIHFIRRYFSMTVPQWRHEDLKIFIICQYLKRFKYFYRNDRNEKKFNDYLLKVIIQNIILIMFNNYKHIIII